MSKMPAWRLEQALRRRGVLVDEPAARGGAQRLRRKTRRAQRFRGSGSLLTRLHLARVQPTTNDPWHLGRVSPPSSLSQSASQPVIAPVTAPVTRPAGCECGPCHCGAPSSGCRRARRASPVAPACLAAGFNHPLWVTVPHWSGDKESAEHTHSGRAGAFGPQVPDLPLKFFSVSPDCCPSNVRVMGVIKVHTHVSSRDHMATNALKSNPTTQEARYQVPDGFRVRKLPRYRVTYSAVTRLPCLLRTCGPGCRAAAFTGQEAGQWARREMDGTFLGSWNQIPRAGHPFVP